MLDKREMRFLKGLSKTRVVSESDETMAQHLESEGVIKVDYKAYPTTHVCRTLTELGRDLYRSQRIEDSPVLNFLDEMYSLF